MKEIPINIGLILSSLKLRRIVAKYNGRFDRVVPCLNFLSHVHVRSLCGLFRLFQCCNNQAFCVKQENTLVTHHHSFAEYSLHMVHVHLLRVL